MDYLRNCNHLVKWKILLAIAIAFVYELVAHAELVISNLGETYTIDFQDYTGAGLQRGGGGGTLDSSSWELRFFNEDEFQATGLRETHGAGLFGRGLSTGGVETAGYYAFETGDGNRALGLQSGPNGFSGGDPNLFLRNQTGRVVDVLHVKYEAWVYNDSDSSSYFDLEFDTETGFIDPVFLETPLLADESPEWTKTQLDYDLFLPIEGFDGTLHELEDGDTIWIRWAIGGEFDALNGYDEVAVDNIEITAYVAEELSGDYNFDYRVNGSDLLTWQRGESFSPLDPEDLFYWESTYGAYVEADSVVEFGVPEPSGLLLLGMAMTAVTALRCSNLA